MAPINKIPSLFSNSERGNSILRKLDFWLGIPALLLLVLPVKLARFFRREKRGDINRIGLFCPGAIGDLLLASALVDGLKKAAPHASLEMICSHANSQALQLLPGLNSARSFPVTKPLRIIKYVRRQNYDLFFDLSQWSRLGAIVSALSGASKTIGFRTARQFRHFVYDRAVIHNSHAHELKNFLALGSALFPGLTGQPRLKLALIVPASGKKQICCHMWPGGSGRKELKEWPASRWAALICALKDNHDVILTGSPADLEANRNFKARYFPNDPKLLVAQPESLPKVAEMFLQSEAVISVNTGIMHLAALLDVPTIGLHGPTNPSRWGPVGKKSIALLSPKGDRAYLDLGFEYPRTGGDSMQHLTVESVLSALQALGIS